MEKKIKTAVIYARYSSSSQTEQSIEGQLSVCEKYAKDNNLYIVDTYIDRAMTGTNDNRASFQQMIADSKNASWDIVLVYAIDRFGRNSVDVAMNKHKLQNNGKTLISATQRTSVNIDGTKNLDGILLENVYIGIAEYYSAELSEKINRGLNENRKKGLFCGGVVAYGYKVEDKKVVIEESEAEVVKFIFSQYAVGVYVPQIIDKLTEQGLLLNGRPLKPNMIYGILRKEKYIGLYKVHDVIYDNIYPQIIDRETFEEVQRRLANNYKGKGAVHTTYLFKDKLKCGYCGKPFSAECGTSRNGKKVHYYKCRGKKKYKSDCPKTTLRKDDFENFILDVLIEKLSNPEVMNNLINGVMQTQSNLLLENPKLSAMQRELKQVETSLNNLVSALERGIISSTANKRFQELEQRQQDLEKDISIEKCKTTICVNETQVRAFYEKALRLEAQVLIGTIVKEIIVYNDKIDIFLNSPIRMSPDENRGFSFYKKQLTMSIHIEPYELNIEVEMFTI